MPEVKTLTPYEAGKMMHKNAEFVRAGLRSNRFNFGTAVPPKEAGGKWNYIIIASKLYEFLGIKGEITNEN